MANNYKIYGIEEIADDTFLTLVGSIGSVCNGFSRAAWAMLMDRFGFRRIFLIMMIIQVLF